MGEYPQCGHNTIFANHPSTIGLKTAENRWTECFCIVDSMLTKVMQVQRLHMNLICDFVAISCESSNINDFRHRRDLAEKQKKECERLEEETRSLKKDMLERVLCSETDQLNLLTLPRCLKENIESLTLECDVKREKDEELIDENQSVDTPSVEGEEKDVKFVRAFETVNGQEQNGCNVVFVDTDSPVMSVGSSTSKCDPWIEVKHESDVELIDERNPYESVYQSETSDLGASNLLKISAKTEDCAGPDSTPIWEQLPNNREYGREIVKKKNSSEHTQTANSKKTHACKICGKEFTHKIDLVIHTRMHTGERPYECNICAKKFARKSHLIEHLRMHSGETQFKCEFCERKFCNNSRLTSHMRVHSGEKPHECEICVKKFSHQGSLNRHMRIHDGEKAFECEVCGGKFRFRANLICHLRIHNGEKPFECKICFRKFSESGSLNRHLRSHADEKPYECEICAKKFKLKFQLTRHMRVHTGEKPYECEICSNKFRASWTLKLHMRVHEGKISYEC